MNIGHPQKHTHSSHVCRAEIGRTAGWAICAVPVITPVLRTNEHIFEQEEH
jgi:hypothetical protein